ncbi:hypothetical protein BO70DRAFT_362546 [Aspergillus heteromorphus CBS 117.55]|uniref:Uncharacterized protein n=1 Tax=Aspergillus heteromorphus CBS 117.55 TaxID=1448321 RepID=A0A317W296_9EURO|nr:uncharacterized protein BO70DRAFT_362546 [Aspergillus heteromorphus CBS 117.55]PWY80593.1 hypothetical protein BO70DRAFT_362546 [Aspergillus heteromorphus CBS 117.55]
MADLSRSAIIVFVILGCVVFTLIGYSIHFLATNGFRDDERSHEIPHEQAVYMRQLRLRDLHWLARDNGLKEPPAPPV